MSPPVETGPPPEARIVRDEPSWDGLRAEWDELFEASPQAAPPLSFEWLRSWWRVYGAAYGAGDRPLRIVTVRRGARLVAALPLYEGRRGRRPVRVRRLGFLGTGEDEREEICPDYLDVLARPDAGAGDLDALADAVAGLGWDHLNLLDIPEGSPLVGLVGRLAGGAPSEVVPRGVCPIADLGGGFEAYLGALSAKTRQHARQYLRAAGRAGATFTLAGAADVDRAFDDLARLHQRRWNEDGMPGCFAAPRFAEFHRHLARRWVPVGKAVLATLALDGRPIAVLYGFVGGRKFDYYQSGIENRSFGRLESPGTAAILMLMRELAGQGVSRFDFLRGSSSQKQRLATDRAPLVAIEARRGTLRSRAFASARAVRGGVRRLWTGSGGRPPEGPPT